MMITNVINWFDRNICIWNDLVCKKGGSKCNNKRNSKEILTLIILQKKT